MRETVTVGFDGSEQSRYAVDFAVHEAVLRKLPLHIVHAAMIPVAGGRHFAGSPGWHEGHIDDAVREMVDEVVEDVRRRFSGVEVHGDVIAAMSAGGTMIEQSRDAAVLVMGSRGRGGFTGLLLGSTSSQVASHAYCPVVITRQPPDPAPPADAPIVVGVDDSPLAQEALRFAFTEARLRAAELVALQAWQFEVPVIAVGAAAVYSFDSEQTEEQVKTSLDNALSDWRREYPDVTVRQRVQHGDPRHALLEAAGERAAMLVVASRGRGGFARLVLGSTSHAVVQHAKIPVAVVNPRAYE